MTRTPPTDEQYRQIGKGCGIIFLALLALFALAVVVWAWRVAIS
jgi:cbb3-type cytochrome oxidase subunit 3